MCHADMFCFIHSIFSIFQPRDQTFVHNAVKNTWASSRLQNDICHMAPSISEVLLDILDVLQVNCDSYASSMKKRVNELESNLQKYGSTMSLNLSDDEAESVSLSDPGSSEIQRFRRDYRSAYDQCNDMVAGLDRFLSSAQHFGNCFNFCLIRLSNLTMSLFTQITSLSAFLIIVNFDIPTISFLSFIRSFICLFMI